MSCICKCKATDSGDDLPVARLFPEHDRHLHDNKAEADITWQNSHCEPGTVRPLRMTTISALRVTSPMPCRSVLPSHTCNASSLSTSQVHFPFLFQAHTPHVSMSYSQSGQVARPCPPDTTSRDQQPHASVPSISGEVYVWHGQFNVLMQRSWFLSPLRRRAHRFVVASKDSRIHWAGISNAQDICLHWFRSVPCVVASCKQNAIVPRPCLR
jgi:hypothetical protein